MIERLRIGALCICCVVSSCSVENSVEVIDSVRTPIERHRSELSDQGYVDAQKDRCGRGKRFLARPFIEESQEYNEGYRLGELLIEEHPELCAIVRALLPEVVEV